MKRILKFFVLVSLMFSLLLTAASCKNSTGKNPSEENTTTKEEQTTPVVIPTETTPVVTPEATTPVVTPEETTPEVTTPEVTTPEVTTPEVTTPEVTTPEETTPEVTTPEVTTPEVTTPEETTPEVTTPEVTTPEVTTPEETTPEVTTPEVTTPEETTPEVTTPEVTTPEETTPEETTPEVTTPEETTPEVTTPEETTPEETTPEETTPEETTPEENPPVTPPVHEHTIVTDEAVAPTCTKAGLTEGSHCSECGEVIVAQQEVAALAHEDTNADYKCDACSTVVPPVADSVLTMEQAIALGKLYASDKYTTGKYYVTGVITEVYNTQYGNMKITDGTNILTIYGTWSADGETSYKDLETKPGVGDTVTIYGVVGQYNNVPQIKNGWITTHTACDHQYEVIESASATCTTDGYIKSVCTVCELNTVIEVLPALGHSYDHGKCSNCGANYESTTTIVFDFGANGTAKHEDGNDLGTSKSYTAGGYTLQLTGLSKVYGTAYDEKGNSGIKLGTSKVIGSFTFTVPEDVNKVIIYAAKYKANNTTVDVNGTKYTLTKNSNDGEYQAIEVDTSVNKTVTFKTVESTFRAMINTIEFIAGAPCEHIYDNTCDANCNLCNAEREVQHTVVIDEAVAPKCEETGLTEGSHCSVCGQIIIAQEVVAATGHTPVVDAAVAPKCEETGLSEGSHCSVCNEVLVAQEVVAATGHTPVVDAAVAPKCEETGLSEGSHCSVCDKILVAQKEVAATGHTYGDWIIDTPATEDTEGAKHQVCSACGDINEAIIPTLDHVHNYTESVVDPTCTTPGYTEYTCVCGDSYKTNERNPLGHTTVVDAAVDATCTENGLTEGSHCSTCNEVFVAQEVVKATGHATTKAYIVIDGVLYYAATCGCEGQREVVEEGTTVEVANEADLKTVLTAGYSVKLTADINLTSNIKLEAAQKVTIDLGGKTITADWTDLEGVVDVLWACGEGIEVTITGNGTMKCGKNGGSTCVVSATDGAKVTIENGTFQAGGSACIYATRTGVVIINDGTFSADELYYDNGYLLDVNEAEELGTITVYGGSFKNFDPANHTNDGQDNTNKVANGYHSIKDGDYYVVSAHVYESNVTDPTCEEDGYTTYTCVCGDTYTEKGEDALGHNYESVVTDPTCEEAGYTTYTCTVCGDTYTEDGEAALGHNYESVVNDPTCEEDGYTTYTCACGDTYTEAGEAALGHTWVDATCTTPKTCSTCGATEGDAPGHNYYYGTCSECEAKIEFAVTNATISFADKANRTEYSSSKQVWEQNGITITNNKGSSTNSVGDYAAPARFYKSSTVTIAYPGMTKIVINAVSDYVDGWNNTINGATVTVSGTTVTIVFNNPTDSVTLTMGAQARANNITVTCEERCNHTPDAEATCTTAQRCTICGATVTAALDHNYDNETITTAATCTTDGLKTLTCTCGDSKTEVIPATGHSYDNEAITTAATCTTDGLKTLTCACGDTITEVISAIGHIFVDGKCECGAEDENGTTTVIFNVPDGVDAVVMGDGNVLPSAGAPDGYTFAGWSEEELDETTTKPTVLEAGSVYEGVATVLYAVYTRTETSPRTQQFVKVTSAPTDWSGQYLIVYEAGKVAFDGSLTALDTAKKALGITINNGVIQATDTLKNSMFTIAKSGSNYTIKSASGYYIGQSSNANGLKSSTSSSYANTISMNADGSVNLVSGGAYLRYNAASDQLRFRYYKSSSYSGQKAICLYQLVETEGTTTTYYATL